MNDAIHMALQFVTSTLAFFAVYKGESYLLFVICVVGLAYFFALLASQIYLQKYGN